MRWTKFFLFAGGLEIADIELRNVDQDRIGRNGLPHRGSFHPRIGRRGKSRNHRPGGAKAHLPAIPVSPPACGGFSHRRTSRQDRLATPIDCEPPAIPSRWKSCQGRRFDAPAPCAGRLLLAPRLFRSRASRKRAREGRHRRRDATAPAKGHRETASRRSQPETTLALSAINRAALGRHGCGRCAGPRQGWIVPSASRRWRRPTSAKFMSDIRRERMRRSQCFAANGECLIVVRAGLGIIAGGSECRCQCSRASSQRPGASGPMPLCGFPMPVRCTNGPGQSRPFSSTVFPGWRAKPPSADAWPLELPYAARAIAPSRFALAGNPFVFTNRSPRTLECADGRRVLRPSVSLWMASACSKQLWAAA